MDEDIINKTKFNYSNFFKQNKSKIFSLIILLVCSIIILIIINEFKNSKNIDISEKYNKAKILIEKKDNQGAVKNRTGLTRIFHKRAPALACPLPL